MLVNTDAIKFKMLALATDIDNLKGVLANKKHLNGKTLEFKTMKYMKKDLNNKKREYRSLSKLLSKAKLGVYNV